MSDLNPMMSTHTMADENTCGSHERPIAVRSVLVPVTKYKARKKSLALPTLPRGTVVAVMACVAALGAALLTGVSVVDGAGAPTSWHGGPFWALPLAWLGTAILAGLALLVENRVARTLATLLFGATAIGLLGIIEPYGVFHDSWRNIGLGQLALSPDHAGQAYGNPYVGASPGGFLVLGLLRALVPDTASMLRLYPLFIMAVYFVGVYLLCTAFYDAHLESSEPQRRTRFGLLGAFSFLAIASIFSVRINPAPQTVAFALLPFVLAAVLRSKENWRYRLLGLGLFWALVLTHPITSVMAAAICGAFLFAGFCIRGQVKQVISLNTVVTYSSLFLAWLIYIGVWVLEEGGEFVTRMLSVLNSDQHASIAAGGGAALWDFIWTHRVAMGLAGMLMLAGLAVSWKANRAAGLRLFAWLGISSAWVPLMFLGEFADRGPLFASLPAAIAIAFLLDTRAGDTRARVARGAVAAAVVVMAVTAFGTSYTNHVGEVITPAEVQAFSAIAKAYPQDKIAYGYVPPFTGEDLPVYTTDRIRAYALGAADFSYDRLLRQSGVIAVSTGMREAVTLRGPRALAAYEEFLRQLQDESRYRLVYANDYVRAYRAR